MLQNRPLIFLWFHALLQLSAIHLANMVVSVLSLTYVGVLEHGLEVTVSNVSPIKWHGHFTSHLTEN